MVAYSPIFAWMICWSRRSSDADVRVYVSHMMARAPDTNSTAYHSAMRSPNARANWLWGSKDITDAADGVQQLRLERPVDLVAQPAHEHIDDVGLRIEVVVPDLRQNHCARNDMAGVAHQVFEQRE